MNSTMREVNCNDYQAKPISDGQMNNKGNQPAGP